MKYAKTDNRADVLNNQYSEKYNNPHRLSTVDICSPTLDTRLVKRNRILQDNEKGACLINISKEMELPGFRILHKFNQEF